MFIIKHRNIFLSISAALVVASIIFIASFGLNLGIDFKGGSLIEVEYSNVRPENSVLQSKLSSADFNNILIQPTGEKGLIIKTLEITNDQKNDLVEVLSSDGNTLTEKSFTSIGPSVGKELRKKSIISIILVSLGIIFYIAYAFRKVSKPISSWKYGFMAIISLLHDIIIPTGVFAILGHYFGAEVDTLFVVALLTILGLSVSDTIVVFDRIRENIRLEQNKPFKDIVGHSLSQVFARSINTSLTVILALLALVFFGPESTRYFAIILTVGMFFGTYSSIFLASPLLVKMEEWQKKK
jgi:preprotein translocase subunit SecF